MRNFIILFVFILLLASCSENSTNNNMVGTISIYYVIPNPVGSDDNKEEFGLRGSENGLFRDLGWYIKDNENSKWTFDEKVPVQPNQIIRVISDKQARLLNSGDTIYLYNNKDVKVQTVIFGSTKDGDTVWVKN